jgi:arylsulfatase A-like enzyme
VVAAAGAGAFGFGLPALVDVVTSRLMPAPAEAIAAIALLGCLGGALGALAGALWPGGLRMTGSALVAGGLGVAAALLSLGVLFVLGAELQLDYLATITLLSVAAPPIVFGLVAATARQLLPSGWSPTRAGAGLWASCLVILLGGGLAPLFGTHRVACTFALLAAAAAAAWLTRRLPGHAALDGALALVLALMLSWPGPELPTAPAEPRATPGSIVMIVLDTTRADALGAYGAAPGSTPALDRIASEGAVFEQLISPSPWTAPSHASMFTGLYPRSHGVRHGTKRRLDESFETTAERLAAAGYETAAISSNTWLRVTNSVQGFEHFEEVNHLPRDKLILARLMRYSGVGWEQWIDRGAAEAETAIGRWMEGLDPERPFFLFLNLFEAHNPYLPPLRDREPGSWLGGIRAMRGYHPIRWHSHPPAEGWRTEATRRLYDAGVRYQDRRVGRILELIGERADLDDLLLVVTSDHGDNLGDASRWGHNFALNDALIRVPLILRAPERIRAGERIGEAHETLDLHATLLDWAGLAPDGSPARSLLPEKRRGREATFAEYYPDLWMLGRIDPEGPREPRDYDTPIWAIRKNGFKLVVRRGESRLYNLRADPGEARDLSAEQPEQSAALRRELDAWLEAHPGPKPGSAGAERSAPETLDPETRRQLEALGYL